MFNKKEFSLDMAVAESQRCLLCFDPPCSKGCPGGTDPGTFIRKLRLKNLTGAIRTIKNNNVLGDACGRLCPSHRLCEKECSACGIDRPIQIGKIQSALIEHSWRLKIPVIEKRNTAKGKVAVIGAGPAGLSAAYELAKHGVEVTIFEERAEAGGVLRYGVPAERLPLENLRKEVSTLEEIGVRFLFNTEIGVTKNSEELLKEGFDAVFLSTGLWSSVSIETNNAKKPAGVFSSQEFLEAQREHCPVNVNEKIVAVIGGGSVAIDAAMSAIRNGAKDVNIIYRRTFKEMPAEADERIDALEAGVNLLTLNRPVEYISGDDGRLKQIRLLRTKLGEVGKDGRRRPVDIEGSAWVIPADIAIEAAGYKAPDNAAATRPTVKTDKNNLVIADPETMKTSVRGVFAGGDAVRGPSLVIQAIKDGKTAAAEILKTLKNGGQK